MDETPEMEMGDELYPNDGAFFAVSINDPARTRQAAVAKGKAKASKDYLNQTVTRLQARIDYYSNVASISIESRTKPAEFMIQWKANQQTALNLKLELEYWKGELRLANR